MSSTTYRLFVYGSLRSGFRNPAYAYLTRYFRCLGEGVVKGKLYDTGTYPVAISSVSESFINGELYQLNNEEEFAWVFEQLDDYEGLNVEDGEMPMYKREMVTVFQEGSPCDAWIYWFNGKVEGMNEISTGDVLKYLQQKNKP